MEIREFIEKYKVLIGIIILIFVALLFKSGGLQNLFEVGVEKEYYYPGDNVKGNIWGSISAVNYGDGYYPMCDGDNAYIWIEIRDPDEKLIASRLKIQEECITYLPISWSIKLSEDAKIGTYTVKSYYCADIGCSFGEKHTFGSTTFRVVPSCNDECSSGRTKCVGYKYYTCGNYDSDPCLEWSSGKIKIGKCGVECITNSDCPSGYTCSNYKCEFEGECYSGETKCEGYYYYVCEDGEWDYKGIVIGKCGVECYSGDTRCAGYNYYVCSNYEWNNEGKVIGECGVECITNSDCPSGYTCSNYKCELTEKTCEDFGYFSNPPTCDSGTPETISVDSLTCYTGKCVTNINIYYIIGGIIAFLIIILSILYYKL